jgi:hypothetical protein
MRSIISAVIAGLVCLAASHPALATIYSLNDSLADIGAPEVSISGTITTDGTLGVLSAANISGWGMTINVGQPFSPVTLTDGNSSLFLSGNDLTADAKSLFWNYDDSDPNNSLEFGIEARALPGFLGATPGFIRAGFEYTDDLSDPGGFVIDYLFRTSMPVCCGDPALDQRSGNTVIATDPTPIPTAFPLFATGLGGLGLLGWRRKRKAQAVA